jgi:hypothetical protein
MKQLWYRIRSSKIVNFIINCYKFKTELADFNNYDYSFNLRLFKRSLELTAACIKDGNEENSNRLRKFKRIKKVIRCMDRHVDGFDIYYRLATYVALKSFTEEERQLIVSEDANIGIELFNSRSELYRRFSMERSRLMNEMENSDWEYIWKSIKGLPTEFIKLLMLNDRQDINEITDGSDMRGWWD